MKIVRQTPTEIVARDSSIWMTVIFVVWFLVMAGITVRAQNWRGFAFSFLLLLAAIAWLRRSTFTFDAARQMIFWSRLRTLRTAGGEIPFSAVQDIRIDESTGGSSASSVTIYRPTIVTASGEVPMADVYSSGHDHIVTLRNTLLAFVRGEPSADAGVGAAIQANPDADRAAQINQSVRALLREGRKVDAILLVQREDHLDLTEATFRVNQIDSQMRGDTVGN